MKSICGWLVTYGLFVPVAEFTKLMITLTGFLADISLRLNTKKSEDN